MRNDDNSKQECGMRLRTVLLAFCLVWILATAQATLAQHEVHNPKAAIGAVPSELLERALPLRQGIGKVHEEVSTSSRDAQAYYDQGLAYLHSFVWIEAARSFHQALRLDPAIAMAYLGLSDSYIGLQDVGAARAALEKAESLTGDKVESERLRIVIRARQLDYLDDSGNLQKYFAYRQAITDALAVKPNDAWLWILRGFADEGTPFAHGQGGGVDTIAFYETALQLSPDSFVAHHYLAHTFENRGLAKEATQESEKYVRLCPAIPHAHHMHGHNLRRSGHTEEAIEEFLKAQQLENAYYRAENIPAQLDWHHAHNLNLLAMSYQALGQLRAAEAAFREAFSLPTYTDFADFNRKAWPEFLLDHGRVEESLSASRALAESRGPMARFAGHALTGRALAAMNRLEEAKSELNLAEREMEQLPPAVIKLLVDGEVLQAEIMLREGKREKGNVLAKKIEEEIVAVPGPDAWSEALFQLEYMARMARETDDWDLAESTAQKMIQHDPSYAGGYLALGLSAQHRGDVAAAKREFTKADELWSKADPGIQGSQVQGP
jgi:tetratricopeptide (TPR) repeat protein